jgi:protein phosphatase
VLALILLLVAVIGFAGWKWSQTQYYVANDGDDVAIFQGVEATVPGINTHHVEETSSLQLDDLPDYNARQVRDGISANNLADARGIVSRLRRLAPCPTPTPSPSASPTAKPQKSPSAAAKPRKNRTPAASATPRPSQSPSPSPSGLCAETP